MEIKINSKRRDVVCLTSYQGKNEQAAVAGVSPLLVAMWQDASRGHLQCVQALTSRGGKQDSPLTISPAKSGVTVTNQVRALLSALFVASHEGLGINQSISFTLTFTHVALKSLDFSALLRHCGTGW